MLIYTKTKKLRRYFLGIMRWHFDLLAGNPIEDSKNFVTLTVNITLQLYLLMAKTPFMYALSPLPFLPQPWLILIEYPSFSGHSYIFNSSVVYLYISLSKIKAKFHNRICKRMYWIENFDTAYKQHYICILWFCFPSSPLRVVWRFNFVG